MVTHIRRWLTVLMSVMALAVLMSDTAGMQTLAPHPTPNGMSVRAAQLLVTAREIAMQPISTAPVWLSAALMLSACAGLLLSNGMLNHRIAQIHNTQRRTLENSADADLNQRRNETRARLTHVLAVESLAAQLIADALRRPVELRPLLLLADAEPAPYFSVTDVRNVRYFFTTDPALFKRLRIVRRADPTCNVSALSTSARADMLAAWEALTQLQNFTHIAMPRGADWHVIAYNPLRERASLLTKLRTWRNKRRIDAQSDGASAIAVDVMPAECAPETLLLAAPATGGVA